MNVTIGEMSRLTGIPVKTIRYYSEIGLVPEAGRSAARYRRYDEAGLARLELVRALRDLGLDLVTVGTVVERQADLAAIAQAQVEAIDLHIHQLTLRRAVLRVIARSASRPEEVQRMNAFARASADESRRLMDEFLSAVFVDDPEAPFATRMRSALPELPGEPSAVQTDAWIELATLVSDPGFRSRVRQMVTEEARWRATSGISDQDEATRAAGQAVVERAGAALSAGMEPESPEATAIVGEVTGLFASAAQREDGPAYREELSAQLETFGDRRVERYWQLIGIINGWPERPSLTPAYDWFLAALRASG